jgi:hypothetical protein
MRRWGMDKDMLIRSLYEDFDGDKKAWYEYYGAEINCAFGLPW